MKKNILLVILLTISFYTYSQITLRGCNAALSDQDFVLVQTGTIDDAGIIRNTFESSPADFTQSCNSGVCEVRIIWSIANARWEIQLDNDGPITIPEYTTGTIYYNEESSFPNPPDLTFGTWIDNLEGSCGGDGSISTLEGDVQNSSSLSMRELDIEKMVSIYPNPTTDVITIRNNSILKLNSVIIEDSRGRTLKNISFTSVERKQVIDVKSLKKGIYFVTITSDKNKFTKKFIVN